MSFRCDTCKEIAPPGTPQHKVVTETKLIGGNPQIKKEINVCDPCYKQAKDQEN